MRGAPALLLALALSATFAAPAAAADPTALTISAPASAAIGDRVAVEARLTNTRGDPIEAATILFVTSLAFLNGAGDVVMADARTGKDGIAKAEYEVRSAGRLAVRAVFRGDPHYLAAEASAEMTVSDGTARFAQEVGIRIPGLNSPPSVGVVLSETRGPLAALWPAMSGWPIAAALLILWSTYAFVVRLIFAIAQTSRTQPAPERHAGDGHAVAYPHGEERIG